MPIHIYDPDEAVAKGAAIYGYKLKTERQRAEQAKTTQQDALVGAVPREINVAQQTTTPQTELVVENIKKVHNLSITNVASRSFGILAKMQTGGNHEFKDVISNLVFANDPLPQKKQLTYSTFKVNMTVAEIKIVENLLMENIVDDPSMGEIIGTIQLPLPSALPAGSPIEVLFELNQQGRLHVVGREPSTNTQINATIETSGGITTEEMQQASKRSQILFIS